MEQNTNKANSETNSETNASQFSKKITSPDVDGNTQDIPPASPEPIEFDQTEQLKSEVAEFKDKYIRMMAEVDNMRRRMDREKADLVKYALEGIFKDLLPALDSLEQALPSHEIEVEGNQPIAAARVGSEGEKAYQEGMIMVKRQLLEVLKRHGLEVIRAKGEFFDPNLHQAIQRFEDNGVEKDLVKDEYALGYTLHGRLLRPAMVSVLTPSGT